MCSNKGAHVLENLSKVKPLVRGGVCWRLNPDWTVRGKPLTTDLYFCISRQVHTHLHTPEETCIPLRRMRGQQLQCLPVRSCCLHRGGGSGDWQLSVLLEEQSFREGVAWALGGPGTLEPSTWASGQCGRSFCTFEERLVL